MQTLCKTCNGIQGTDTVNFTSNQTDLRAPPTELPAVPFPTEERAKDPAQWEIFLRRWINFSYRCSAVDTVEIGSKGDRLRTLRVRLFPGNDPSWVAAHLSNLATEIRECREEAGYSILRPRLSQSTNHGPHAESKLESDQDGPPTESDHARSRS